MDDMTSVALLFCQFNKSLSLNWLYGEHLPARLIQPLSLYPNNQLYAAVYPPQAHTPIVLFGAKEIQAFSDLPEHQQLQTIQRLFNPDRRLFIVCDASHLPSRLFSRAKRYRIPIFSTHLSTEHIMNHLNQALHTYYADAVTKHGVFLEVLNMGVLLVGDSGIGKSELALGLIHQGHRLIADDAVTLSKTKDGKIIGSCPTILKDFLEVRGLGIINIRAMFGDKAIKESKQLQLIIRIIIMDHVQMNSIDRAKGLHFEQDILGVNIPGVTIPVAPGRNLAVLVEAAVRDEMLSITGYRASEDFRKRQEKFMQKPDVSK